jgi:hypothetical protein
MKMVVLVTLLAACFGEEPPPRPLAELPDPQVIVHGGPERLNVRVSAQAAEVHEDCWRLDDSFEARVGDRAVAIVSPGTSDDGFCSDPQLELLAPDPTPDATLVIEDDSKSISVPLGHMLVLRTAELEPAGPWSLSPGQSVSARVVPADDLERPFMSVWLHPAAGDEVSLHASGGELFTFQVPASAAPQQAQLELTLTEWSREVPCEGARCWRAQDQTWLQPITIAPPP